MFESDDDDDFDLEEMEGMDLEDQFEVLLDHALGPKYASDSERFDDDAIFDEVTERIPT